jgi:hypothetical protein
MDLFLAIQWSTETGRDYTFRFTRGLLMMIGLTPEDPNVIHRTVAAHWCTRSAGIGSWIAITWFSRLPYSPADALRSVGSGLCL